MDFEELALTGSQIANGKIFFEDFSSAYSVYLVHFYGPISQRTFLYNLGIDVRATVRLF